MKKMLVKCNTTPEEIIEIGKAYYAEMGYDAMTATADTGNLYLWVHAPATSCSIYLTVDKKDDRTYMLTAGWVDWIFHHSLVAPPVPPVGYIVLAGINRFRLRKMPEEFLNRITAELKAAHPECTVYYVV